MYNLLKTISLPGDDITVLNNMVQPTLDMHKFNGITVFKSQATSAASATHTFTVPAGKRWTYMHGLMSRINAGDCTAYILDSAASYTTDIERGTAVTFLIVNDFNPISLTEGNQIQFVYGAGVSGNLVSIAVVLEEDV